ncbi:MAG: cytochrome c biogenesis protein CcsA [Promethearchaeota archaeon]|jgi:cytochrome c-type biogenesis protein CcmF
MNYSNSTLPLIYKIVAIWAGEEGSILTWMFFNSFLINFYRITNRNKEDIVFLRSVTLSLIISTVFAGILFYMNPFKVDSPPFFPNGLGLNPLLISPFMIWHPFFTFISYAVFLIPFTIVIAETLSRKSKLLGTYQQSFFKFSLKFGWLVLTLSIGLGAYWAKIALSWGRYWGWDPVETVSLIPWFFITGYFHTISFKKKNPNLVKINIGLIFLSIIFSTLITRGGGLASLHAFAGDTQLVLWVVLIGLFLVIFSLYVIYVVLDYLLEEYRKTKALFDYLSYIFLFGLSFVCIIGLFIPPLTQFLSNFLPLNIIFIGPEYFIITALVLAVGLALSLIFCSLWENFELKWIAIMIGIIMVIYTIFSMIWLALGTWINPLIIIYFIALFASLYKFVKNINLKKGIKYFFRINAKTIIHAGISLILIGTLIDPNALNYQDFFFISGFIVLMIGIIPSIIIPFFFKKTN